MVVGFAVGGEVVPDITAGGSLTSGIFWSSGLPLATMPRSRRFAGCRDSSAARSVQVVGADAGDGPDMPAAGDFGRVVKVVEHAELQGQLVLVGVLLAVHGQAGVAVPTGLPSFSGRREADVGAVPLRM